MKITISTPEQSAENALDELENQRIDYEYEINRNRISSRELPKELQTVNSIFWRKHLGDYNKGYFPLFK